MPTSADDIRLLDHILSTGREHESVEFKLNLSDPATIGKFISSLANSAALTEVASAFLIWGIEDDTRSITGTTFDPYSTRIGNQSLIPWLHSQIEPQVAIQFRQVEYRGNRVVLLQIGAARSNPVRFQKTAYIRIDSHLVELSHHPAYEQRLWSVLLREPADQATALSGLSAADVLDLLDAETYFVRIRRLVPKDKASIVKQLQQHRFIRAQQDGRWEIRTHAALLFARNLEDFGHLGRKAIRIVQYAGDNRIETIREFRDLRGYAAAFDDVHQRIMDLLPAREQVVGARRTVETMLPSLAIREALANALVHQDLILRGSRPMVELFTSRIEVTNPGTPLVDVNRLIDAPPRSRNETLASIMRELDFCEERGSGWDKIAYEVGIRFLPAPTIAVTNDHTRVTLFGPESLNRLSKEERVWATYIHACLLYCQHEYLTNARVRDRFDIASRNSATASRIIADAVESGWLIVYDPHASKKMMQYIPYWAGSGEG